MACCEDKSVFSFFIVWSGQLISSIGSGMTAFVLGVYAFQQTHSATYFSAVILSAFVPSFFLTPLGGVLSDRYDRRMMMVLGDLGATLGLFFILFILHSGHHSVIFLYGGVAISSVFVAIQSPAYKASVTDLLDEAFYSKAGGLLQLAESAKYLISPILAGCFMSIMNITSILLLDIATYFVAVGAVFWIRKGHRSVISPRESHSMMADFLFGLRFVFSHKGVWGLLIITSGVTFLIGFLQTLLGPMLLCFADPKSLGLTLTLSATGMFWGSLLIGVLGKNTKMVTVLARSLALAGFFYAMMGIRANIPFLIAMGFCFFFALPFVNTSLEVLLRTHIENSLQGRVWGLVSSISQIGILVSFCTAGILADRIFNPLLLPNGLLASSVGALIGVGPGRGIGLMFVLCGTGVVLAAVIVSESSRIRVLEKTSSL